MSHLVAPSVLSADFGNLQRDIELINSSDADWFHIDIMDGAFVPNISFGFPVLKAIQKHAKKPLDVHLMIVDPDRYTQLFKDAGADVLTVHIEACTISDIQAEKSKVNIDKNKLNYQINVTRADYHDIVKIYGKEQFDSIYFLGEF